MKSIDKMRDMLLLILLLTALCGLTHAYVYTLNCPVLSQWTTRANGMCNISNRYHCLYDANKKQNMEACRDGPMFEAPGYKIQIIGSFERVPCANDRFQPITFWTNSNLCKFGKSVCTDEGQVLFSLGTAKTDSTCRCDYTKGYDFVVRPKSSCFCFPSEEDCSCFTRSCPSGFVLSPDYQCASVEEVLANLQCPISTIRGEYPEIQIIPTKELDYTHGINGVAISKIVVPVLILPTIGICVVYIIIVGFLQKNIYEDEQKMQKGIPIQEHARKMGSFKDSLIGFKPTIASNEILLMITENPCVLITGPFGSGKTVIAYSIISKLEKEGYKTIFVSEPEQINRYFQPNQRQLFLMDDILGKYSSSKPDIVDKLEKCGSTINSILKKSDTAKVLITCRTYIYQLYKQYFESFSQQISFIHKSLISEKLRLTLEDRKEIFKSYFQSDPSELLSDDLLLMYHFYPLICSSYKCNGEHMLEYFKHPDEIVSAEISAMRRRSDISYLALAILVVFNNKVENKLLFDVINSSRTDNNIFQDIFKESCFNQYPSKVMLQMTFGSLKGEFIKDNEMFLSFLCPELFDIAAKCIGGSFMQSILKHSSSVFIKEKLQLSPPHGNDCAHAITVPNDMEDQFSERLISDMNNNFIFDVLSNKILQSEKYRQTFIADLQKHVKSKTLVDELTRSNVLHIVSALGYSDLIMYFLRYDKCPDINKADIRKKTPLHIACQNGHMRCVQCLIKYRAAVNETDRNKRTALHYACEAGKEDIVKLLITNGTSINNKDLKGMTPLHIACKKGYLLVVKCLVAKKPLINETDKKEKTPLHYACEHRLCSIAEVLILNKAHVNKPDEQDYTPLHIACEYGNEEVIKLLVERKAVINSKNKQGQTPLDIALKNQLDSILNLLRQCEKNK